MILNSAFARIHHYVVVFESYGDVIKIQERAACCSNSFYQRGFTIGIITIL